MRCIEKLRTEFGRDVIFIYVKDPVRDIQTQILSVDISDNQIHKTDSLPGKLKMCVGQELLMLTANISTSGSVKNGSTGKIEYMQMPRGENNLIDIIHVKFDNVEAGIFLKNCFLKNGMKECVLITALTKTFCYSHKNKTVTLQ